MRPRLLRAIAKIMRGVTTAVRAKPKVFSGVALGVFALSLVLPVVVLSLARGPFTHITWNPWLTRLPEWLASSDVPLSRKLEFLADMALGWVVANNPMGEVEWGFILDVPSLARFIVTSLLFGAYFALWAYRRDQMKRCGWETSVSKHGGIAGTLTSVLGLSTAPCTVMGCGVPVLPVIGMAVTGVSSGTLTFFSEASRIAIGVVLVAVSGGVAWLGWLVGREPQDPQRPRAPISIGVLAFVVAALLASVAGAQGEVSLEWYGHAFFRLTSPQGVRAAMDPFGEIGYPMPTVEAEIVTVSHEHSDHNNAKLIRGTPTILRGLTEGEDWKPISFRQRDVGITSVPVPVYHDPQQGRLRGKNNIIVVDLGGLRVVHLSDMGHVPTEAQFQALGRVDVLLVPVGGNFSIDGRQARRIVERLNPRVAIPIHYKTAATARWPIEDERAFVEGYPRVKRIAGSRVSLNPVALPAVTEIWVLEPPTGR